MPSHEAVLAFGGDVTLARRQHVLLARQGLKSVNLPSFRSADLRIVNLECVISGLGEQGRDKGEGGPYYFRARPEMVAILAGMGVDAVATANNHSGDYGPEALLDQARWLEVAGIAHAGSGKDREAAFAPRFLSRRGLRIALFSVDATQSQFAAAADRPGNAYLPIGKAEAWFSEMQPRFRKAREVADIVLVAAHWGPNLKAVPGPRQIAAGHALIEAGADAVLGSSAHVLQGIEIYKGRPILHDAGNLLCDFADGGNDGAIFRLGLTAEGVRSIEVVPLHVEAGRSRELSGPGAGQAIRRFDRLCQDLGTIGPIGEDGRLRIGLTPPPRTDLPPSWGRDPARFTVTEVPAAAQVPPAALGPLRLVGIGPWPKRLSRRELLWVETYWTAPQPVGQRLFLDLQAVPAGSGDGMPPWGRGMWHEPCDWMLPTSEWEPGVIYRERFGLRPPPTRRIWNGPLELVIGVRTTAATLGTLRTGRRVEIAIDRAQPGAAAPSGAVPDLRPLNAAIPADGRTDAPEDGWTAGQLERITGGSWITPPADGWRAQSVTAGVSHIGLVPGPVILAAHTLQDRIRHENFSDPPKRDWDSHRRLREHAGRLAGAIVRYRPEGLPPDFPLLQVEDPLLAAQRIGVAARQRLRGKVICVTGSAGKTSTVAMMGEVLSRAIETRTTYDNYNTRVGLLVNLAGTPAETEALVLETALSAINSAGQRHVRLVAPEIAVITNIATAHMRENETTLDIARKKSNIFLGMPPGGVAVLWRGAEHFGFMAGRAREAGLALRSYGSEEDADFRLLAFDAATGEAAVHTPSGPLGYRLGARSAHMALNSLACLAVAAELGLELPELLPGFAGTEALSGRGKLHRLVYDGKEIRLQDDSYNANPASMRAALQSFGLTSAQARRRVLVLGDMLELGPAAAGLHRGLVPDILATGAAKAVLVGEEMPGLAPLLEAGGLQAETAGTVEEVIGRLPALLADGDALLVKSSNGMGLSALVEHLLSRHSGG